MSSPERQLKNKCCTESFFTFHWNTAAMYLNQFFCKCKSDTCTFIFPCCWIIHLEKAIENMRQTILWNSDTWIPDFNFNISNSFRFKTIWRINFLIYFNIKTNFHFTSCGSELQSIRQKIVHNFFNFILLKINRNIIDGCFEFQINSFSPGNRFKRTGEISDQRDNVFPWSFKLHFTGIEFREIKQLIN